MILFLYIFEATWSSLSVDFTLFPKCKNNKQLFEVA